MVVLLQLLFRVPQPRANTVELVEGDAASVAVLRDALALIVLRDGAAASLFEERPVDGKMYLLPAREFGEL